jgi:hypothetical protein
VSHKMAALSNIALHPIHTDTKMAHIGSDHDLAESEWDLGEAIYDAQDMWDEQERNNTTPIADPGFL